MKKSEALLRYHPLFASPVWLTRERAEAALAREDALYLRMVAAGMRPQAPRIERAAPRA